MRIFHIIIHLCFKMDLLRQNRTQTKKQEEEAKRMSEAKTQILIM